MKRLFWALYCQLTWTPLNTFEINWNWMSLDVIRLDDTERIQTPASMINMQCKVFLELNAQGFEPNKYFRLCCILTQLLVNTDAVQMNFHSSAENSKLSGEVNGQTFSHLNYFRHMKCLKTLSCSDSVAAGVDFKMSSNKHTHTHTHTHTPEQIHVKWTHSSSIVLYLTGSCFIWGNWIQSKALSHNTYLVTNTQIIYNLCFIINTLQFLP